MVNRVNTKYIYTVLNININYIKYPPKRNMGASCVHAGEAKESEYRRTEWYGAKRKTIERIIR